MEKPVGKSSERSISGQKEIAGYEAKITYYRYYKPDSAVYFAERAITLAKRMGDSTGLARMLNQMGMINDNLGKPEDSRKNYLHARGIYQSIGNKKGQATETIRLGVVELRKGNYDRAIGYFLEALKLSESIKDKAGIMEAYLTVAEGYMGQKQYDTALKYLKIAERLNSQLPFTSLSLNICSNFGVIYREKGNFKQAVSYLKKGLELSNTPQLQGLHITLLNNLASVYSKAGLKKEAIQLQKEALLKAREIRNYIRELQTLSGLASIYGKNQPQTAIFYLQQARTLAEEKKAYKPEIDILQDLGDLYKYLKNYKAALEMKEKEHALADSIFYHDMSARIANLQVDYELNKSKARVQELKFLNSKQTLERKVILYITGGIVILLLIVVYSYFRTRKLNLLLHRTNEDLKESNSIKDKLFSVLGHDLRSPLSSVINTLFLLEDETLTQTERKELIDGLAKSCNASLETLTRLLKWGEMQIKGIKINQQQFNPIPITEQNIALLSEASAKKSIIIENLLEEPASVFADPDHFDFIMRNLLSNAVKFTPPAGAIRISASHSANDRMVIFTVKDSGVGIESSRLKSIFTVRNVSTRGTGNEEGTSLGLLMCREFIEANDGTISVKSERGKGSEFTFSLPTRPPQKA